MKRLPGLGVVANLVELPRTLKMKRARLLARLKNTRKENLVGSSILRETKFVAKDEGV